MSRSYNEHHKLFRKTKYPSPCTDNEGKLDRHRKMKAYGSKGYCGWGGEVYIKKWGEIMIDLVNKVRARRNAKKQIQEQLNENN